MILFQNIDVYAPEYLGRKDVLTVYDKIVKIADAGTITADGLLSGAETVDGTGLVLTPGFVDCHVHVLGGGGEGGFANRTPEATMEGLNKFGVTTVVGCLGTDGIGRDMCALVAKTKGLREQGMSAWCYTGSYQVPVRTLTDGITKDIMMIQEIIGTGEIAISDHRSSQPTFEEFVRVVADTRLGGVLSGKAGVVNVHLGDGPRCMDLIERVVEETEVPASQILPTHINRNEKLFCEAIEYAKKGGNVDFTGIIFIYGILYFSEGIISFLFEGTWLLNGLINHGELDRLLLRPVPIVVQVLSMKMNFDGLGKIILSIVIMSQALMNISIQWNIGKIIMLIVFVVSASVIRVCLNIVANSSSFWLKGSRNSLPHMVYTIWEFGKYPINIFSGAIQFILLTILPYAFMGFLPAAYMFDKPIYASVALITPVVAFIWIIISVVVFRLGLNRYESTGN